MTCDLHLQTTQILLRGTTIRLTPRNSYAPCGTKADHHVGDPLSFRGLFPSASSRLNVAVSAVIRRRRYVTRRRRYAILFYFPKIETAALLQQRFENGILPSYRNLKLLFTLCMCVTHTLVVMCNPKHCTAHSYCGVWNCCAPPQ